MKKENETVGIAMLENKKWSPPIFMQYPKHQKTILIAPTIPRDWSLNSDKEIDY